VGEHIDTVYRGGVLLGPAGQHQRQPGGGVELPQRVRVQPRVDLVEAVQDGQDPVGGQQRGGQARPAGIRRGERGMVAGELPGQPVP
jgi:hypothetical protein